MASAGYGEAGASAPLVDGLREAVSDLNVGRLSSDRLQPVLVQAVAAFSQHRSQIEDPVQASLADATLSLLAASAVVLQATGTCRVEEPFADVYPVIDPDGSGGYVRRLCCTHPQQHCVSG